MTRVLDRNGMYRTEDGRPLRKATEAQRQRRAQKRKAKYPEVGRSQSNVYRRVAIASLNEAHQRIDYYKSVVCRLERIDREGVKVCDQYIMRDVRRAGSREQLLANLLHAVRYTLNTASHFGKNAGGTMLPA